MNRNIEIERAIEVRGFNEQEKDAFRMGAHWADTHPIYPDGIPVKGPKSPGEILAVLSVLRVYSHGNESFVKLYDVMVENVKEGRDAFWGVEFELEDKRGKEGAGGKR